VTNPTDQFRQELLTAQKISPELQTAYQKELNSMLHRPMTLRSAAPGSILLAVLLICTILVARAAFLYHVSHLMLAGYIILAAGFIFASILILRDLRNRTHSRKSVSSIANALTLAAGSLTVVALLLGLRNPSDPKSLFGAFYVFVFYFACAIWALDARISTAELTAREQSLRIEYHLADLADHLKK
jgi:hypothetical protein